MKKLILVAIIALLYNTRAHAQLDNKMKDSNGSFSMSGFYPNTIGNNFINKGHKPNAGIALETHFRVYNPIQLGFGYSFTNYSVTNIELVGNYFRTNHSTFYFCITAPLPISNKISISPQLTYGLSWLRGKKNSNNIGRQDGQEFRIGSKLIYSLSNSFGVFLSLHFVNNQLEMKTNPEIQDFYNQSQALYFGLGFIVF